MAHHITKFDNMVSGMNQTPWHGLGRVVKGALTAQEALTLGGLDWKVLQGKNFRQKFNQFEEIPNSFHLFRSNDGLIVNEHCTQDYTIVQNEELFSFFDPLVSRKEAMYHTAGSLKAGRIVWILAKLPGEIILPGNDITEKYALVGASHDGSLPVFIKMTPIRVVCWNTLTQSLSGKMGKEGMTSDTIKIRHSSKAQEKIAKASEALGLINQQYEVFRQAAEKMRATNLKEENVKAYFEACFDMTPEKQADLHKRGATVWSNKFNDLLKLHESGMGSELCRGTAWGAYNALTEWVDHHSRNKDQDTQVQNNWLPGPKEDLKRKALELALQL